VATMTTINTINPIDRLSVVMRILLASHFQSRM